MTRNSYNFVWEEEKDFFSDLEDAIQFLESFFGSQILEAHRKKARNTSTFRNKKFPELITSIDWVKNNIIAMKLHKGNPENIHSDKVMYYATLLKKISSIKNFESLILNRFKTDFESTLFECECAALAVENGAKVQFIESGTDNNKKTPDLDIVKNNHSFQGECKCKDKFIETHGVNMNDDFLTEIKQMDDFGFTRIYQFFHIDSMTQKIKGEILDDLKKINKLDKTTQLISGRDYAIHLNRISNRQSPLVKQDINGKVLGVGSIFNLDNSFEIGFTADFDEDGVTHIDKAFVFANIFIKLKTHSINQIIKTFNDARKQINAPPGVIYLNLDFSLLPEDCHEIFFSLMIPSIKRVFQPNMNTRIAAVVLFHEHVSKNSDETRWKRYFTRIDNPYCRVKHNGGFIYRAEDDIIEFANAET